MATEVVVNANERKEWEALVGKDLRALTGRIRYVRRHFTTVSFADAAALGKALVDATGLRVSGLASKGSVSRARTALLVFGPWADDTTLAEAIRDGSRGEITGSLDRLYYVWKRAADEGNVAEEPENVSLEQVSDMLATVADPEVDMKSLKDNGREKDEGLASIMREVHAARKRGVGDDIIVKALAELK